MCVRFINVNKLIRTGIILFGICLLYCVPPLLHFRNDKLQSEIESMNVFKADLSCWNGGDLIGRNVNLIILLSVLVVAVVFLIVGLLVHINQSKNNK